MRTGWTKQKEDLKRQRRRYKLHYLLRKLGNSVVATKKTIIKRQTELSEIEMKYLVELAGYGYGICDKLF
jgi:hypothetical protein